MSMFGILGIMLLLLFLSAAIKVSNVEVKHIDLPQEMQRAMAKQAEAERERRAKVINAEGEH
jgi:regulator of protease activity HflC (stomatin/prohibitin superfamily)